MPKEKITCMGCDKKFQLLLSHLERTKSCQDSYDMSAIRKEAEKLTKEKKAQRSRERYQNDASESPKKRAAAKEHYKQHTPEKRAAMALYNERHREEINEAKREQYHKDPEMKQAKRDYYNETRSQYGKQKCPECDQEFFTKGDMKRHIDHAHTEGNFHTCQICDKHFEYKQNLERHMTEVHGGERHKCENCPASYSRASDLQEHIKEGWHYLTFYCKQCSKTIVFKHLSGLIDHTIVKQSEGEVEYDGIKSKTYKSGILVTCKSQVESTQLKEGEPVLYTEWKDKVKASKERAMKKEEIINEGLQSTTWNLVAPKVKLEMISEKHEENFYKDRCKWCQEKIPFSDECCSVNFSVAWKLH